VQGPLLLTLAAPPRRPLLRRPTAASQPSVARRQPQGASGGHPLALTLQVRMRARRARVVRAPLPTSPPPPSLGSRGTCHARSGPMPQRWKQWTPSCRIRWRGWWRGCDRRSDGARAAAHCRRPALARRPASRPRGCGRSSRDGLSESSHSLAAVSESVQRVMLKVTELRGRWRRCRLRPSNGVELITTPATEEWLVAF